jgi:hypothetical protein
VSHKQLPNPDEPNSQEKKETDAEARSRDSELLEAQARKRRNVHEIIAYTADMLKSIFGA